MAKKFLPQIVTGNELTSGDVVFRTASSGWSRSIAEAIVAETQEEAEVLLKAALADSGTRAVSIELIEVDNRASPVVPLHIRERIRLTGPTVKSDFRV